MKSWKTSVFGTIILVSQLLMGSGILSPKAASVVSSISGAAGLIAAKDNNVTGGTIKQ